MLKNEINVEFSNILNGLDSKYTGIIVIKDNFDSFKTKYELEGNTLLSDLNKKIVGEIENRFNNKINTNLCSYYKDLMEYKRKVNVMEVKVKDMVERNKRKQDTDRGFMMSIKKLQDDKLDITIFKDGKNGLKDDIKNDVLHELNMKNIYNDKCLDYISIANKIKFDFYNELKEKDLG